MQVALGRGEGRSILAMAEGRLDRLERRMVRLEERIERNFPEPASGYFTTAISVGKWGLMGLGALTVLVFLYQQGGQGSSASFTPFLSAEDETALVMYQPATTLFEKTVAVLNPFGPMQTAMQSVVSSVAQNYRGLVDSASWYATRALTVTCLTAFGYAAHGTARLVRSFRG